MATLEPSINTKTGAEKILWDLAPLFSGLSDPKIEPIISNTLQKAAQFTKTYKGKLANLSAEKLRETFREREAFLAPFQQLQQFSSLCFAKNTADEKAKTLLFRIDETASLLSNQLLFCHLELSDMPSESFQKFDQTPPLKNYRYLIHLIRKNAAFNLSEPEEKIINLKDLTGTNAFQNLYEEFTSSFTFKIKVDGTTQTMNGAQLRALRQHPDPQTRQKAMKLFFNEYKKYELIITKTYNSIIKDFNIEKSLRGYPSAIGIMNRHNDIPDEAVAQLHQVTTDSYHLVNRYYKIKQKLLKLPKMTLADIYAPLPETQKFYTWDYAKQTVLDGLQKFDLEFYGYAKRLFDENRIDAPILPNKRGGAFCSSSTPDIAPYILVNFLGKLRDISTLAHELGHGIHDFFCSKQTLFNYHPRLPLAETASVFSEMLITDLLLKKETDPLARQSLLCAKLEDIFATSHRQNMFSSFEIDAHQAISDRYASTQALSDCYLGKLKQMFGDSVEYPLEYQWEWMSIPHIFQVPFYVYAYNFGNLLVMALYQKYKEESQSFIPLYKEFLSKGSSESPQDICASIGIDICQPTIWKKSIQYIESLIDQLENCK